MGISDWIDIPVALFMIFSVVFSTTVTLSSASVIIGYLTVVTKDSITVVWILCVVCALYIVVVTAAEEDFVVALSVVDARVEGSIEGIGEGIEGKEGTGEGVGEGTGEGVGEGTGEGVGEGTGEGVGEEVGEGTGEEVGEGTLVRVGEETGEEVGEGTGEGVGEGTGEGVGEDSVESANKETTFSFRCCRISRLH